MFSRHSLGNMQHKKLQVVQQWPYAQPALSW